MKLTKNFIREETNNPLTIAGSGFCRSFEVTKQQTTMTNLHNSDQEYWKDIPEYEGYYQASNLGRIKSLQRTVATLHNKFKVNKERILRYTQNRGYNQCALCKEGKPITVKVHRIIALAWLGESSLDVNHKDLNKLNNRIDNLEYLSKTDNRKHAIGLGRYKRREVICLNTGKIFESIKIAAEYLGMTRESLSGQLHGSRFNHTTMRLYDTATK